MFRSYLRTVQNCGYVIVFICVSSSMKGSDIHCDLELFWQCQCFLKRYSVVHMWFQITLGICLKSIFLCFKVYLLNLIDLET